MATLTRSNSRVNPPVYKDYVNFLASYKNGKKEDENTISSVPVRNFSLSNSSNSTSSSSLSSDVTDFPKTSCTPFTTYLENTKTKKFSPVKPAFEEKEQPPQKEQKEQPHEEKKQQTSMKSEIFIEIQPTKSVSEVSRMFELQQGRKSPPKSSKMNSKIRIFEKQVSVEKPKLATKPAFSKSPPPKINIYDNTSPPPSITSPPPKINIYESTSPPPKINIYESTSPPPSMASPPPKINIHENTSSPPPKFDTPKDVTPPPSAASPPPPPPLPTAAPQKPVTNGNTPPQMAQKTGGLGMPPPPPPPANLSQPVKLQATLVKGPQTKYSVNNPNGAGPIEIDRNNPLVKKLVYGTLRGLYGAYHDQANDMLATLPKNMVVRSNGVQDRIEQIAANGDLEKLNGRVNPKLDQE